MGDETERSKAPRLFFVAMSDDLFLAKIGFISLTHAMIKNTNGFSLPIFLVFSFEERARGKNRCSSQIEFQFVVDGLDQNLAF